MLFGSNHEKSTGGLMNEEYKPVILVVDDVPANIHILNATLKDDYFIRAATDGRTALALAHSEPVPDLVLLDIMMPGMDGYEVCRRLKEDERTRDIPVVFISARDQEHDAARGFDLGAVDYITKPYNTRLVQARVRNHLLSKRQRDELAEKVRERTLELTLTQTATIESLAILAESHAPGSGNHIPRTQCYVEMLARRLRAQDPALWNLSDEDINLLSATAPLHDIGKVGVPDAILLKPGPLTPKEFAVVCTHTTLGYETLSRAQMLAGGSNPFLRMGAEIAHSHHERWDGKGYPLRLRGAAIPVCGRIMALADSLDAMISRLVESIA